MDILFKNDDFVFSYRVGGILIQSIRVVATSGLLTNDNFIFEYLNHVCNQLDE